MTGEPTSGTPGSPDAPAPRTPGGAALSPGEQALVDAYEQLVTTLREHGDELAPFAQRNAIKATAALWQVVNGLGLAPGQLYDIGV